MSTFLETATKISNTFIQLGLDKLNSKWEGVISGPRGRGDIILTYRLAMTRSRVWGPKGILFVKVNYDAENEQVLAHLVDEVGWELTLNGVTHLGRLAEWEQEEEDDDI
jgi:hypothetical protein